ncbi:MAG: hypothetical protein LBM25_03460 [Bacteroidales bacterium]|jgi:hypothetical protein|nr:hypothetical protein [Bacteroidales bacterium]
MLKKRVNSMITFVNPAVEQILDKLDLSVIIKHLEDNFSSRDFFIEFISLYEGEFIDILYYYKGRGAFEKAHTQISLYLSENKSKYGIEKVEKEYAENIFGYVAKIQYWKKT